VILTTGSTSSISGTLEHICTLPPPANAETAIRARPYSENGAVPYQEIIRHPALGNAMTNSGAFHATGTGTLIRRQTSPVFEELEISAESILIRRKGKETERRISVRLALFLSTLAAIVTGKPEDIDGSYSQNLEIRPDGWTVLLTTPKNPKEVIALTGCGPVLSTLQVRSPNGQQRQFRFVAP